MKEIDDKLRDMKICAAINIAEPCNKDIKNQLYNSAPWQLCNMIKSNAPRQQNWEELGPELAFLFVGQLPDNITE